MWWLMAWCSVAWRGQNCVGRSFDFGMLSRVTTLATQSITSGVQTSTMIQGWRRPDFRT